MHEVLVNPLGGLSLPRKTVVRLTDRLDMIVAVYQGGETTKQLQGPEMKLFDFTIQFAYKRCTCRWNGKQFRPC